MKKALLLASITFLMTGFLSAQESKSAMLPDSLGNPDSVLIATDSTFNNIEDNLTVFDVYWVTNCIKSGWKASDTAFVGVGLEPCDTVHPFIMPVDGKFWRGCTYYHSGWDVGCAYGTPVRAGLSGKVRFAGYSSGYGKLVIVRHYSGMEMYYAHLSRILVSVNHYLEAGDTLGLVGATGRAKGNHLHMEFRICDRTLNIADYYVQNDSVVNLYKIKETLKKRALPQGEEIYTIVRGDTLSGIASRYGTTVTNLCALNNISRTSTLRIGQRLKLR